MFGYEDELQGQISDLKKEITKLKWHLSDIKGSKLLVHGLDGRIYKPETIEEWESSKNCQKGDILYRTTEIKRY